MKTAQVIRFLQAGYTVSEVARKTQTSEVFVATVLQHFERAGQTDSAALLCSSGLGACHTPTHLLSEQVRLTCAGCPLEIKKKPGRAPGKSGLLLHRRR